MESLLIEAIRTAPGFTNLLVAGAIVWLTREVHGLKKVVEFALPRVENLRERVAVLEALRDEDDAA